MSQCLIEPAHYSVIHVWCGGAGSLNLYDWNAFMDKHIVEAELSDQQQQQQQGGSRRGQGGDAWFQQCKWLTSRGQGTGHSRHGAAGM